MNDSFEKRLFTKHCSECHGKNAASTPEWRKPGPDGRYPPPPLNGSAHTWHHPLPLLQRTIREGGIKLGGTMPPFKDKLSAPEIDAIIMAGEDLRHVERSQEPHDIPARFH